MTISKSAPTNMMSEAHGNKPGCTLTISIYLDCSGDGEVNLGLYTDDRKHELA